MAQGVRGMRRASVSGMRRLSVSAAAAKQKQQIKRKDVASLLNAIVRSALAECDHDGRRLGMLLRSSFEEDEVTASQFAGLEQLLKTATLTSQDYQLVFRYISPQSDSISISDLVTFMMAEVDRIGREVKFTVTNYLRDEDGLEQLKDIFVTLDVDGNGTLSRDEFSSGIKEMGLNLSMLDASLAFSHVDTDGSGSVTLEEFIDMMEREIRNYSVEREIVKKLTDSVGDRDGLDDLVKVFNQFDVDNTGDITQAEFAAAFASRGLELSHEEVERVFPIFDTDQSGTIDLGEFVAIQKSELEMQQITKVDFSLHENMTDKEKRAFDRMHRKTLAAVEGGVRVNRSGSTVNDLKLQGDSEMLEMKNVLKRTKLKEHKHVRKSIKGFWNSVDKHTCPHTGEEKGIGKETYIMLNTVLHKTLVPDVSDEEAHQTALQDWEEDISHLEGDHMPFDAFSESMFELADMWVDGISSDGYKKFIKNMHKQYNAAAKKIHKHGKKFEGGGRDKAKARKAFAEMGTAERYAFASMTEAEQKIFIEMTADQRKSMLHMSKAERQCILSLSPDEREAVMSMPPEQVKAYVKISNGGRKSIFELNENETNSMLTATSTAADARPSRRFRRASRPQQYTIDASGQIVDATGKVLGFKDPDSGQLLSPTGEPLDIENVVVNEVQIQGEFDLTDRVTPVDENGNPLRPGSAQEIVKLLAAARSNTKGDGEHGEGQHKFDFVDGSQASMAASGQRAVNVQIPSPHNTTASLNSIPAQNFSHRGGAKTGAAGIMNEYGLSSSMDSVFAPITIFKSNDFNPDKGFRTPHPVIDIRPLLEQGKQLETEFYQGIQMAKNPPLPPPEVSYSAPVLQIEEKAKTTSAFRMVGHKTSAKKTLRGGDCEEESAEYSIGKGDTTMCSPVQSPTVGRGQFHPLAIPHDTHAFSKITDQSSPTGRQMRASRGVVLSPVRRRSHLRGRASPTRSPTRCTAIKRFSRGSDLHVLSASAASVSCPTIPESRAPKFSSNKKTLRLPEIRSSAFANSQ